jgi:4-aminobutyrate aminotransferase
MIMSWHPSYATVPALRTPLPGPKAARLIASDEACMSPSYTRVYPLAVERGEGAAIEDVDGNVFLDFTAGIAVCSTGHCHPRVVSAIQKQASRLIHMSGTDFYYAPQRDLAQKLAKLAPGSSPKRVFFTNSGAEAVEAAFKLARYHTGRPHMIAFFGAFHGRTMGALSLTGSKVTQRRGFEPLIPEVTHVGYGHCYRCPYNLRYPSCAIECVHHIEKELFRRTVPAEKVAAIIVEPIQGEGGYVVPPPEFHRELKALAERHGILYIADEVQTGMGRTGKMFAIEHWGVEPDIICLAKGLASGMPLGAMVAKADIMNWARGSHASTFGGNPVSCVASLETIALLEEELTANAARQGDLLKAGLNALKAKHPLIGDVRGLGLMLAIELVKDDLLKTPAARERDELVQTCFHKGLLLLGCGESSIRFCPPLVIDHEDVETALQILDEALTAVETRELTSTR